MKADEYNRREIEEGRLTAEHLLAIFDISRLDLESEIRSFQRLVKMNVVDGKAGPMTRAASELRPVSGGLPGPVYQPIQGGCYWSGNRFRPGHHNGRDGFDGPKEDAGWPNSGGAVVVSIASGKVTKVRARKNGLWVRIDHGHGIVAAYGHLESPGTVSEGDVVPGGQPLGVLWDRVHPPHIHFEIRRDGKLVEPVRYLESVGAAACV